MKNPIILINDFSGGLTLNEKKGRPDQFHTGYQLDFSSKAGKLAPGYAWAHMTESSNVYVPDEMQAMLFTQEDNQMYFGGDDAKIYKRSSSSAILFDTASDQTGAIRGFVEHQGNMYYPQNTTLGKADLAGAYDHDFQTGLASVTYHPLFKSVDGNMYVGGGTSGRNYVDKVTSAGAYSADALDLPAGWTIRTICDLGHLYLAIGADYFVTGSAPSSTKIYLWNRSGETWNDELIIPEKGIKAMIYTAGYLWIWAGRSCNIYVVGEGSRKVTKVWSFTKENPDDKFEVYPNAVAERNGTIYFGLSGVGTESVAKNPCGIYSFPADPNKFSLNIAYSIADSSQNYDDRFKSLGLWRESTGDILFASMYDAGHATAANRNQLKMEDIASAPYNDVAVYESFRYEAPPNKRMKTQNFGVTFDTLPTGTGNYADINLYYKKNDDTTWTSVFTSYGGLGLGDGTHEKIVKLGLICDSLKLQLTIRGGSTSSYSRPFIKSIWVTGSLISKNP